MARNFGHPHCFRGPSRRCARPTPARQLLGAFVARLFYSTERVFQCAPYSLGQRDRLARNGIPVRVVAEYMGRVLFFHDGNMYAHAPEKSAQVRGNIR
jgi:hypothetical protein